MNSLGKNDGLSSCEINENLNFLRQTYFFSGLDLEALRVMAYLCSRELFKKGDFLFLQGEDDGQAFYLLEGRASLLRNQDGRMRKIRWVEPGAFLGGISLLGSAHRLFSLRAEEDTLCLILTRDKFSKTLEQFQGMTPKIFKAFLQAIHTWEKGFLADRADACSECLPNLGVTLL